MYLPVKVYGSLGKVLDFCEKMQLGTEGHYTQVYELGDLFNGNPVIGLSQATNSTFWVPSWNPVCGPNLLSGCFATSTI